jgi:hypothetical protein
MKRIIRRVLFMSQAPIVILIILFGPQGRDGATRFMRLGLAAAYVVPITLWHFLSTEQAIKRYRELKYRQQLRGQNYPDN